LLLERSRFWRRFGRRPPGSRRRGIRTPHAVASARADALAGAPLLTFEQLPLARRYLRIVLKLAARGRASVVVDDLRSVRHAVAAGARISVLLRYPVAEELARGELVELHRPPSLPVNVIFRPRRPGPADPIVRRKGKNREAQPLADAIDVSMSPTRRPTWIQEAQISPSRR
jgi:DNA-binding transcriptional LysR family regulator